jgi:hypothetical protein
VVAERADGGGALMRLRIPTIPLGPGESAVDIAPARPREPVP